jgi:23S rRNA (cytosine1962-C5)-methyltransferase
LRVQEGLAPKAALPERPKPTTGREEPARARRGEVVVDGYSERWLRRGFPWVYPKEVRAGQLDPGAEVVVRTATGETLGRGIADRGWLAVRVFRHDAGPLDKAFFADKIAQAQALRDTLIDSGTTGYRVAHAENDGLPGIRIDRWGAHLVIALDTPALAGLLPILVEVLVARFSPDSIHFCYRPDARDTLRTTTEGEAPSPGAMALEPAPGLCYGTAPSGAVTVTERGIKLGVLPADGPDVGVYADMRMTRTWLEPHWRGTRVLNTFAYTGAFSVVAAVHGAARVVTLDLSEKYLARARDNFVLNGLPIDAPDAAEFVAEDVFRGLDRMRRKGELFDRVVLDPPSFSHSEEGMWSADRDYARLVSAACRVLAPGGWLIAASNLGELSPHKFREPIDEGIRKAERQAQEIYFGSQSPDFPAAMWFPEGRYLKVGVWRIL